MTPKLRTSPNGFAAMTRMAQERVDSAIGCTQITEILWMQGVALVAPLPQTLQVPTTYSLGVAARSVDPAAAGAFAERLTGTDAAARLSAAGFGVT